MVFCVNPIACRHLLEEFDKCIDMNKFQESDLTSPICSVCKDPKENWICLQCGIISCSRHVNGHASVHYEETKHPISASFSDHSFWCYTCDTYVHDKCLFDIIDILDTVKFFRDKDNNNNKQDNEDENEDVKEDKINEKEEEPNNNNNNKTTTTTTTTTSNNNSKDVIQEIQKKVENLNLDDSEEDDEKLNSKESLSNSGSNLIRKVLDVFGFKQPSPPAKVLTEMTMNGVAEFIKIGKAKNIIVLTGAGISVAAGIPDFRSPKTGLYANLAKYELPYAEAIFDIDYFKENPKPFFVLSKELYPGSFNPTPVHHFIKLLHDKGLLLRNFTQNIDTLERIAKVPEEKLVEAHGSFATARCLQCRHEHSKEHVREEIFKDKVPMCLECKVGVVKPDITFFGESLPPRFAQCVSNDFDKCDLLIIIGTSLKVQPFASLVNHAKNVPRLLLNYEIVGTSPFNGSFNFDQPDNIYDVKWIGDCQKGILEFANHLGWSSDLEKLINPPTNTNTTTTSTTTPSTNTQLNK